jgi:hypothetical protein
LFGARQPVATAHSHNPSGPATDAEEKSLCDVEVSLLLEASGSWAFHRS